MGNQYQSPRPEVVIYKPDDKTKPRLRFDTSNLKSLQAYSFGTSINDEKGRFTLTFYPDDEKLLNNDEEESIFDKIQIMDIVEFYESKNHFRQNVPQIGVTLENFKPSPTFTGVVRDKKITVQVTDSGVSRRLTVTGHSIAGLISEFIINLDVTAQAILKQYREDKTLNVELTKLINDGKPPYKIGDVIKKIWRSFLNISSTEETRTLSTPKIAEYIDKWIGGEDSLFDFDDSEIQFYLPNVFRGQTTQTFFDIISGVIPKPMYEIFPFTDNEKGTMRLKIRMVPFLEKWAELHCTEILPDYVRSFELSQNDREVYTVFFAYVQNSAISQDKAIKIATQKEGSDPNLKYNDEKFGKYGYRPLFVNFMGTDILHDGELDTKAGERAGALNEALEKMYSHMEEMYSGSITMRTDLSIDMPQAGEKISFLGGEFYVIDSEHSWSYGAAPETRISVARGGIYGKEEKTVKSNEPERKHTVIDGENFHKIADKYYGDESKYYLIVDANRSSLISRKPSKEEPIEEKLPTIYGAVSHSPNPGHKADVLTIPPDPDKAVEKTETEIKFQKLTGITGRYKVLKSKGRGGEYSIKWQ